MEVKLLTWGLFLVIGFIIGYYVKDNATKPDNQVNIDLEVKKNKLFNSKRKFFNRKKNDIK